MKKYALFVNILSVSYEDSRSLITKQKEAFIYTTPLIFQKKLHFVIVILDVFFHYDPSDLCSIFMARALSIFSYHTLKCYSQIVYRGSPKNVRMWLFCIDLVQTDKKQEILKHSCKNLFGQNY